MTSCSADGVGHRLLEGAGNEERDVVPPPCSAARSGSGPKWETPKSPMKRLQNWIEQTI